MKKLILFLSVAMLSIGAFAQGAGTTVAVSKYSPITLLLSTNVVQGSSTLTFGATTNLTTNIVTTVLYTNNTGSGSPGFVTNSTSTIYTNVAYPWINIQAQSRVGITASFNASVSSSANRTITFAYSLDAVFTNISTTQNISWVIPGNGTTKQVACTNFANLGAGYLLPISIADADATGGEYTTNIVMTYAQKLNAP